jgi:hypothetical protein
LLSAEFHPPLGRQEAAISTTPQIYNLLKSTTDKRWQRAKTLLNASKGRHPLAKLLSSARPQWSKRPYLCATRKAFNLAGEGGDPEIQPSRSITQSQRFYCKAAKPAKYLWMSQR